MTERPPVRIVTRHTWRARPPKRRAYIKTPTPELWWHHFASEHHGHQGMRDIQSFHMDTRGWSDIAYSFCVDEDGTIYEGRGVGVAGGHTAGRNSVSHAICLMGNFQQRPVPRAALQSCAALAAHGIEKGWWTGWTSGHRNAPGASTACPGDFAMKAWRDLTALTDLYATPAPPQKDNDDMPQVLAFFRPTAGSNAENQCYRVVGNTASHCPTPEAIDTALFLGVPWWGGSQDKAWLDPVVWSSLAVLNGPLANIGDQG